MTTALKACWLLAAAMALYACGDAADPSAQAPAASPPPTNRIPLPGHVRENLGITWAEARRGRLDVVLGVPGEIAARPEQSWTVRAPLPGTVTAIAKRWEGVEEGDMVAELSAPALADWQAELQEQRQRAEKARMALARTRAELAPARALADTLEQVAEDARRAVERARVARDEARRVAGAAESRLAEVIRLRESEAVSAVTLLDARRDAVELRRGANDAERAYRAARIEAAEVALRASRARADVRQSDRRVSLLAARLAAAEGAFEQKLQALAVTSGLATGALTNTRNGAPAWARLQRLTLRAPSSGVVVRVRASVGTWVERNQALVEIIDPTQVVFRASIPEGDVARLPGELSVEVEAAGVEGVFETDRAALRPLADATTRSVLLEAWLSNEEGRLRVGNSATAQVRLRRGRGEEVLIPMDCVVRDGLESVVFKRDPGDPDQLIRKVVTLGERSGGWTEVISGVGAGDRLVRDGVHQLRHAGQGRTPVGGHFHADGTWHEDHK